MSQKLKELTEKLYQEGVEKAENQGKIILAEAEAEKQQMLQAARKESEELMARARREAQGLVEKGKSELTLASRQAVSTLKQRMVSLLSDRILSQGLAAALGEKEFLQGIIKDLVSRWDKGENSLDLKVVLNEKTQENFKDYLRESLGELIKKGLELRFEGRMTGGFSLEAQDGSLKLAFSDKDFEEYFRSFVKEQSQALLFAEN